MRWPSRPTARPSPRGVGTAKSASGAWRMEDHWRHSSQPRGYPGLPGATLRDDGPAQGRETREIVGDAPDQGAAIGGGRRGEALLSEPGEDGAVDRVPRPGFGDGLRAGGDDVGQRA